MPIITVTNNADSGVGSLRQAIANAQVGDTIVFASNVTSITLNSPVVVPSNRNLTIDGGAAGVTLNGTGAGRLLTVSDFNTVTLRNLTLQNGNASGTTDPTDRGGAVYANFRVNLIVENVNFLSNTARNAGSAIYLGFESNLSVNNSRFNGNQAIAGNDERGATISTVTPGIVAIRNSDFTNNRGINGAAINVINAQLTVENSRFINNDVLAARFATGQVRDFLRGYGGAIYTDRANDAITIRNSVFEGNQSRAAGGAVHLFADPVDTVTIEDSLFRNNRAIGLINAAGQPAGEQGNAGAITHVRNSPGGGTLTLNRVSVIDNFAQTGGGGLWVNQTTKTTIQNSTFSGNQTGFNPPNNFSQNGGAILLSTNAAADIINTTIANNTAGWAGGAIAAGTAAVLVRNSIFANNTARNPFNIQNQTSRLLNDGGGNIQFPPKATNLGNDNNVTSSILLADPLLGPIQQVGNAVFFTLQTGSPAINRGVAGAPITDQRGAGRVGAPDAGAYEFDGIAPPTQPQLTINNVTIQEGATGAVNAVFQVSLFGSSTLPVQVSYATADGTAIAGADYLPASGILTFNPGETIKNIVVSILQDNLVEPSETFTVRLSNPVNAAITTGQGIGTILDNPPPGTPLAPTTTSPSTPSSSSTATTTAPVPVLSAAIRAALGLGLSPLPSHLNSPSPVVSGVLRPPTPPTPTLASVGSRGLLSSAIRNSILGIPFTTPVGQPQPISTTSPTPAAPVTVKGATNLPGSPTPPRFLGGISAALRQVISANLGQQAPPLPPAPAPTLAAPTPLPTFPAPVAPVPPPAPPAPVPINGAGQAWLPTPTTLLATPRPILSNLIAANHPRFTGTSL